jgi:hypothetical protein
LFCRSLIPGEVVFSNDGPYGGMVAEHNRVPAILTGYWEDLNWLGFQNPSPSPTISCALRLVTSPLVFSKVFPAFSLLVLGLCAWFCFHQWKLTPLACLFGALAAAISSHFLSTACWGVASQTIAVGMNFLAVGWLASANGRGWVKLVLAGMAVGMGVMEGYDIGAIFSLYVAAFLVFQLLTREGALGKKLGQATLRLGILALAAGFLATHALSTLIGTQIKGVVGTEQSPKAKLERWDFATQWSFPPREFARIVVPGLFGYRMDTPKNMAFFKEAFEGGNYRGEVGRDPAWDRFFASDKQGPQPQGSLRFSGGGEYAGIIVVAMALWAFLQSLRKKDSVFSAAQRRQIWFWSTAAFISLLLSFGRYAPFYQLVYMLPYFSTIRNPAKFLHPFHWSLVILFAYGIHGLCRRYLEPQGAAAEGLAAHLKRWWTKAAGFDKKWLQGSAVAIAGSVLIWLIFASSSGNLETQLRETGFSDPNVAHQLASFAVKSVGWYILFLVVTLALLAAVFSGWFAGRRARLGAVLLGGLLMLDLARADLPWLIYWNAPVKYSSNPIIDRLREKPYEQRVAIFPLERFLRLDRLPVEYRPMVEAYLKLYNLYHIEWKQQHFQYYNIQCLDVVQMPRVPEDLNAFAGAMAAAPVRNWELSNNRYLLGPTSTLDLLKQLDRGQDRFRIVTRFNIVPRAGLVSASDPEDLTAVTDPAGEFALFEFTAALPRAKLYGSWQVNTDDPSVLRTLASPSFDPAQSVLVSTMIAPSATNAPAATGTVDFVSYKPKHLVLHAKASASSVLLLNDKYDPNWKVTVDGKPASLLRCNYIMQGVQVSAGEHTIDLRFETSTTWMFVSLGAILIGMGLVGFLAFSRQPLEAAPEAAPVKAAAVLERKR